MRSSISDGGAPAASLRETIRARALSEGFDAAGFARAEAPGGAADGLRQFLERQYHGDMGWMETAAERRSDPKQLWADAKSILVLGVNYAPGRDPLSLSAERGRGAISVYAGGDDYHDVVKKKLKRVASWLAQTYRCEVKVFVDTAPVMEKPLSQAGGIGWQGKHTNLVSREFGSWLFLGSIFTTLEIEPDRSESNHCGSCTNCLDSCPTKAFPAPYQIDATRCISYLTIEHKGHIAHEFREAIGNRIYGCDDCLAVCPWNKFASQTREVAFHARDALVGQLLTELAALDDAGFRALFRGSPVKRIGRDRFIRNVLIAVGNSEDSQLAGVAEARLTDASPLVRAMAVWALSKLLPEVEFARMKQRHELSECDPAVREEWTTSSPASAL